MNGRLEVEKVRVELYIWEFGLLGCVGIWEEFESHLYLESSRKEIKTRKYLLRN